MSLINLQRGAIGNSMSHMGNDKGAHPHGLSHSSSESHRGTVRGRFIAHPGPRSGPSCGKGGCHHL